MGLKYELKCRSLDYRGKVLEGTEGVGYPYEDIVSEIKRPQFEYFVEREFLKISKPVSLEFELEIKNWKYLT